MTIEPGFCLCVCIILLWKVGIYIDTVKNDSSKNWNSFKISAECHCCGQRLITFMAYVPNKKKKYWGIQTYFFFHIDNKIKYFLLLLHLYCILIFYLLLNNHIAGLIILSPLFCRDLFILMIIVMIYSNDRFQNLISLYYWNTNLNAVKSINISWLIRKLSLTKILKNVLDNFEILQPIIFIPKKKLR